MGRSAVKRFVRAGMVESCGDSNVMRQNARSVNGGPNTSDALPPDASATEALENAVEESRREYDKRVETMEEIDDKAMRSVRTAVILVGLVVSGVSVGGPGAISGFSLLPVVLGALGVVSLVVSILFGVGAYSATQYPTGIGETHRNDVITGAYSHDEWFVNMIDEYDEWSEELAEETAKNLRYLEVVQLLLSIGVVSLLVSAGMIVVHRAYGIRPLGTFVGSLVIVFAARIYLGNND
ncbi:hypothetical protein [Halorussus caseinilyticus]|uniref:Uncharacterized protein n=1 Tax=Halorussus caseinilyticus TaxID=3034025 RepID=A0ABD5WPQ3_9EURY|nr:hypothetical protein [Halorussus sp. DT72]